MVFESEVMDKYRGSIYWRFLFNTCAKSFTDTYINYNLFDYGSNAREFRSECALPGFTVVKDFLQDNVYTYCGVDFNLDYDDRKKIRMMKTEDVIKLWDNAKLIPDNKIYMESKCIRESNYGYTNGDPSDNDKWRPEEIMSLQGKLMVLSMLISSSCKSFYNHKIGIQEQLGNNKFKDFTGKIIDTSNFKGISVERVEELETIYKEGEYFNISYKVVYSIFGHKIEVEKKNKIPVFDNPVAIRNDKELFMQGLDRQLFKLEQEAGKEFNSKIPEIKKIMAEGIDTLAQTILLDIYTSNDIQGNLDKILDYSREEKYQNTLKLNMFKAPLLIKLENALGDDIDRFKEWIINSPKIYFITSELQKHAPSLCTKLGLNEDPSAGKMGEMGY